MDPQHVLDDADSGKKVSPSSSSHDGSLEQAPIVVDGKAYHQSRGVDRVEILGQATQKTGRAGKVIFSLIAISIILTVFVVSMESSTIYQYAVFATSSFQEHSSGIAALSTATSIMTAVSKPIIGKIADVWARPYTYTIALAFMTIGLVITAASSTLSAYIVGSSLTAVGSSGLSLLQGILTGDLVPLEWRGFAQGVLSFPYFITVWYTAEIVAAFATDDLWRWGYGMWAILLPVVLIPAIALLIYLERRAYKMHLVNLASAPAARREAAHATLGDSEAQNLGTKELAAVAKDKKPLAQRIYDLAIEIDFLGMLFLGFGWSLLLLPFSLVTYADGGWRNPSMIAMMIVGGLLLFAYAVYEMKWAPVPSAPKRLLFNRTFTLCVLIDFIYQCAGYMHLTYYSSYVYIVTDVDVQAWTYINNTLTLALCGFGVVAGALQRYTHRYKLLQIIGLSVKVIGMGLLLSSAQGNNNVATFVMVQVLIGLGGSMSVIATQVASQASVPHNDLSLVIAMLALWSYIGSSIGSAVSGAVWGTLMPAYLRRELPASVTDAQVAEYFGAITSIKALPWDSPVRQGAVRAYSQVMYKLWAPALGLSFVPLIAAFFMPNYYLGRQQNVVTNTGIGGEALGEGRELEAEHRRTGGNKQKSMWRNIWDL